MKWTDPSDQADRRRFLQLRPRLRLDRAGTAPCSSTCSQHADYLSLHIYVGNPDNDFGDFMASSVELDHRTKTAEGIIDAALSGEPGNRKIYIAWDEWNVWYRARGDAAARPPHSGRALQPRRRAGGGHLPQHVRESRPHREDRQHGATGERDRAHLHQRQGHVPADHLLSRCSCSPTTHKARPWSFSWTARSTRPSASTTCPTSTCPPPSTTARS